MNFRLLTSILLLSFIATNTLHAASSLRSDTIDIRKTIISFTAIDFIGKQVQAKSTLDIKAKQNNISTLLFDLEGLQVDSVKVNNSTELFNQQGESLSITLTTSLSINDTALVEVYYQGIPIADATWGGFSFIGNYGFQMGVGFNAQPHSFGRTWHPCFDNFVERSAYEFYITTENTKKAICNGLFQDSLINGNNTITWHWKLDEEIPSYLASVAICNYVIVSSTLTGLNGNIASEIACEAIDIPKVNGSFAHLQESFSMLENHFGAYSWPKVGYTLVPFNAGAMEHATNIHIGKPFIDGSLNYETLIAHELSHHWWGDLVTCSTAGDMWLNEGWASYCEYLHQEHTYGHDAYIKAVRDNHFDVISNAHINDEGYRAVANMDSLHTYGSTVYLKGADAIHTLRTYLGDANFFDGTQAFLNANKFKAINSGQLRDFLATYSGKDLNPFFDNWIFAPGFTNFTIDSMDVMPNGNLFEVSVFIRQRKHQSNDYYNKVPLEIGFYQDHSSRQIVPFEFTGRCTKLKVTLPFNPKMTIIDPDYKLSDAATEDWKVIKTIGTTSFNYSKSRIRCKTIINNQDSTTIRIEHHWVSPDRFKSQLNANGFVLQSSHYWKVDGINLENITGWLNFPYNVSSSNNYLDSMWLKNTEDSIRLFYRKDAREEWALANDSLVAGNLTDGIGNMYCNSIKAGEYCLGIKRSNYVDPIQTDAPIGGCNVVTNIIDLNYGNKNKLIVKPNPNQGSFIIMNPFNNNEISIEIFDLLGHKLKSNALPLATNQFQIEVLNTPNGMYILNIIDTKSKQQVFEKFIIN